MSPISTTRFSLRPPPRASSGGSRAYIYEREFTEAYSTLGVEPPTYEPRATGHMIDMIDLIKKIIDNGHAYVVRDADGTHRQRVLRCGMLAALRRTHSPEADLGFDAASAVADAMGPSVDPHGQRQVQSGRPGRMPPDKHDPRDFALWKAPKDTDPVDALVDAVWRGPPWLAIECSAMPHRYLKAMFDIHGGGLDLRFPTTKTKMAQTRAAGYASAAALDAFGMGDRQGREDVEVAGHRPVRAERVG